MRMRFNTIEAHLNSLESMKEFFDPQPMVTLFNIDSKGYAPLKRRTQKLNDTCSIQLHNIREQMKQNETTRMEKVKRESELKYLESLYTECMEPLNALDSFLNDDTSIIIYSTDFIPCIPTGWDRLIEYQKCVFAHFDELSTLYREFKAKFDIFNKEFKAFELSITSEVDLEKYKICELKGNDLLKNAKNFSDQLLYLHETIIPHQIKELKPVLQQQILLEVASGELDRCAEKIKYYYELFMIDFREYQKLLPSSSLIIKKRTIPVFNKQRGAFSFLILPLNMCPCGESA